MLLHNTRTRRLSQLIPRDPENITIYSCGPTTYGAPHIGNMRTAVIFDVLTRHLSLTYPKITHITNYTDIDDKIISALLPSPTMAELKTYTDTQIRKYESLRDTLNILPPTHTPRVTDHIPEIISYIQRLISLGHAYPTNSGVYLSIESAPYYGFLSNRPRVPPLQFGEKQSPDDFALWKISSDQIGWHSPWGFGRPGWHIECAALSRAYLGPNIDIHGGGIDLLFPHHENELACATCAHPTENFTNIWFHIGQVQDGEGKLSKSTNAIPVSLLLKTYPSYAIRYFLLSASPSRPVKFTYGALQSAYTTITKYLLRARANTSPPPEHILTALDHNLSFPTVFGRLHSLSPRELYSTLSHMGFTE